MASSRSVANTNRILTAENQRLCAQFHQLMEENTDLREQLILEESKLEEEKQEKAEVINWTRIYLSELEIDVAEIEELASNDGLFAYTVESLITKLTGFLKKGILRLLHVF